MVSSLQIRKAATHQQLRKVGYAEQEGWPEALSERIYTNMYKQTKDLLKLVDLVIIYFGIPSKIYIII